MTLRRSMAFSVLTFALLTACSGPLFPGAGTNQGQGFCGLLQYVVGGTTVPATAPDGTPQVQCNNGSGRSDPATVSITSPGNASCTCGPPGSTVPVLDLFQQMTTVSNNGGVMEDCKVDACLGGLGQPPCGHWMVDPVDCSQLVHAEGFSTAAFGLNTMPPSPKVGGGYDGDDSVDFCATLGSGEFRDGNDQVGTSASVQGLLGVTQAGSSLASTTPHPDALHTEWQWCRWYGGNFSLADGSASWTEFRPQLGERVAMVGDWVVDGTGQPASIPGSSRFTELHEPRIMSTLRQVSGQANTYHLLTSGYFADATAQASQIAVTVPLVPVTGGLKLSPTLPPLASGSGCTEDGVNPPLVTCDNTDPAAPSCRIELDCNGCQVSQHICESNHSRDACPCHGAGGGLTDTCANPLDPTKSISIDSNGSPQNYNRCQPVGPGGGTNQGTTLAWAGDVEVQYLPDPDLWICNCDCQDPSAPGAVIPAEVQGCAAGFRDDVPSELIPACQAACGGAMCGAAPDCHIGACTAADPMQTNLAGSVARDATSCGTGLLPNRVAEAPDYRVDLDHSSSTATITHILGCVGSKCATITVGHPAVQGSIWLNQAADGSLEIVDAALAFDDVNFGGVLGLGAVTTSGVTAYVSSRFDAQSQGGTSYTVDPMVAGDQVGFGVRGVINGQSGGADLMNESGMSVTFDLSTSKFALDGGGSQGSDTVVLSLNGTITGHPPVAVPGPNQLVQCASHTTTPIVLDGRGSYAVDPGDSISHYQWFEDTGGGLSGVGAQPVSTAQASLGGR